MDKITRPDKIADVMETLMAEKKESLRSLRNTKLGTLKTRYFPDASPFAISLAFKEINKRREKLYR